MKKFSAAAVLALCLALTAHQKADAWVNAKFSVGLSFDISCGNNSFGWGLFQSGQVPTPYGWNANCLTPGCYGYGYDPYAGQVAVPMFNGPPVGFYTPQAATGVSPLFHQASYPGYGYYGYGN